MCSATPTSLSHELIIRFQHHVSRVFGSPNLIFTTKSYLANGEGVLCVVTPVLISGIRGRLLPSSDGRGLNNEHG